MQVFDRESLSYQYIGGEWREGRSDRVYEDVNPYSGEVLTSIRLASTVDIDEAYRTADQAQAAWAAVNPYERTAIIEKAAQVLNENRQAICEIIVAETGGSQLKANLEVDIAIGMVKEASKIPLQMYGSIRPSMIPGKENRIYRTPIGVVGVISPFNFPVNLSIRSVAPALAAGNGVVLKPDMQTFMSGGTILAKAFELAGVPKGVLNVVVPDIAEVGDAFVEHPIPGLISFTGSSAVGRHIGEICGRHLKRTALELGGNNVMIVLDDADVDAAVSAAVFGKFMHQGQICMCLNRILVHRSIYDSFVERFVERVKQIKVGDPADPAVHIGPLINGRQVEKVRNLIDSAVQEGARMALEGTFEGNLVSPHVLVDVKNDMTICQREVFGPVASILAFDTTDEGVQIANASEGGLSGSVFTASTERGVNVAKQIRTGMIHVNDQSINDEPIIAFGGEKASGIGRFGGEWTLEEFTTVKWISVQSEYRGFPF